MAELKAWTMHFEKNPDSNAAVAKTLRSWQNDADLACVRDARALANLPSEEQAAWQRLWAGIGALRARAEKDRR
jgi:hypothetical protein